MRFLNRHQLAEEYSKVSGKYLVLFSLPEIDFELPHVEYRKARDETQSNIPFINLMDNHQILADGGGIIEVGTEAEMNSLYKQIRGDDDGAGQYGIYALTISPQYGIENENT
jgi:hypothetical protein